MVSKLDDLLASLNHEQRQAVTAPPNSRLQIIAGPGTGKTKVLISRVAFLILAANIAPEHLIVTTFTKKAAKEMVERLQPVMEGSGIDISKLLIGTFHSICYRIIRRYGSSLGMNNFTIADERDSSLILQEILLGLSEDDRDVLERLPSDETDQFRMKKKDNDDDEKSHGYSAKSFKQHISKLKSSSIAVSTYEKAQGHNRALLLIYQRYQNRLQKEFLLDFDDCLLQCYSLVTRKPVLNFVKHVLVDEFQDTNELQLNLMYEFARGYSLESSFQHNVTIVGDPDQSIYAFREAQVINFKKMEEHYSKKLLLPVTKVLLSENYRSTSDILNISETIMKQQQNRQAKYLTSQYLISFKPVHKILTSTTKEAKWIAYNILYLKSLPNEVFNYLDFSVLVRSAFQTRVIEKELMAQRIPYHMVRGKAFWDRKEVVAIVDHLRVISNPFDRVGFLRTLTFPKKGVGEKTLQKINNHLADCDFTKGDIQDHAMNFILLSSIPEKARKNMVAHIEFIKNYRSRIKGISHNELEEFFEAVYKDSGLLGEFQQDESCDGNIREVQRQLMEYEPQEEDISLYIGGQQEELDNDSRDLISRFITSIGLYETNEEKEEESDSKEGKVALSTIHGSKGLEWPVVFVPGLSDGSLPSKFSIDAEIEAESMNKKHAAQSEPINEERRCFYVATTRAKHILFLSSVVNDNQNGTSWGNRYTTVSRFLKNINGCDKLQSCFKDVESLAKLYTIRNIPMTIDTTFNIDKYYLKFKIFLKEFLEEDYMKVEPLDYENIDLERINEGDDKTRITKHNLSTSIVTAKNILGNKTDEGVMAIRKKMMQQQKKKMVGQTKLPFKSPKPTLSHSSHNLKAPKYSYDSSFRTLNAPKVNTTSNRAPVYIPDRSSSKSRKI